VSDRTPGTGMTQDSGRATAGTADQAPTPGSSSQAQPAGGAGREPQEDRSSQAAQADSGAIYDLGYRNYEGPRLGRRSAVTALATLSLRNTYGLGRGTFPKVLAFGLAAAAMLPAFIIMLIAILVPGDTAGAPAYDDFFAWVNLVLVVFVAAMASDLVGSDRRNHILPLYFSRPVDRSDYVLAKMGALAIGLLPLTLLPQLLIFLGFWLGADDTGSWLSDNYSDLGPILASSVLACVLLATVGLAISMFTSRRAFALMGVLGGLLVARITAGIIIQVAESNWSAVVALLSPLTAMDGAVTVLFDVRETSAGPFEELADTPGWLWVAAPLVHSAVALGIALRRYQKASL